MLTRCKNGIGGEYLTLEAEDVEHGVENLAWVHLPQPPPPKSLFG